MADALRRVGSLLGCKVECRLSLADQHTDCRKLAEAEEGSSCRLGSCLADAGCSQPAVQVEAGCILEVLRRCSGRRSHGHNDHHSVDRRMAHCTHHRLLALLKISICRTLTIGRVAHVSDLCLLDFFLYACPSHEQPRQRHRQQHQLRPDAYSDS